LSEFNGGVVLVLYIFYTETRSQYNTVGSLS